VCCFVISIIVNIVDTGDDNGGEPDPTTQCGDLLIMGLPFSFTNDQLRSHFEQYGVVEMAEVRLYIIAFQHDFVAQNRSCNWTTERLWIYTLS
jgi:RNA recognition motif-containing protein